GVRIAALDAGPEPLHALGAGAVGEAVWRDPAPRLALQCVVADRRGGAQPVLHILGVEGDLAAGDLRRVGDPDPGVAVRLKLEPNRAAFGPARAHPLGLAGGAQEVLHMVAHLVGDDIGPGRLALSPEARAELLPERQVQINLAVVRAIEGSHRRLAGPAACRGGLVVEHDASGRAVGLAGLAEDG